MVTAFAAEDASSRGLLDACGHYGEAVAIDPAALSATVGEGGVEVLVAGVPARTFDALLLVRGIGRNGEPDLQFELYRLLEGGLPILNRLDAMLAAQDKFRTSALLALAGVATPAVRVVQTRGDVATALSDLGACVAKPIWGSLGEGIELLAGRKGRARGLQLLEERNALYLQAFVDHGGRDVRAFVVGGRVEAAIERIAPTGEFRTNVSIGGEPRPIDLSPEAEALAVRAAHVLGLDWAGVDLAFGSDGPTVIEVNGSPNWEGIFRATGRDMAQAIAAHVARRVGAGLRMCAAPID